METTPPLRGRDRQVAESSAGSRSSSRRAILSRREFLALPLIGLLFPRVAVADGPERSVRRYEAEMGILFNLLTFKLSGTIVREIDRAAGRYRATMNATGAGITAGTENAGVIRDGRFMPTMTRGFHIVRGRENRVD